MIFQIKFSLQRNSSHRAWIHNLEIPRRWWTHSNFRLHFLRTESNQSWRHLRYAYRRANRRKPVTMSFFCIWSFFISCWFETYAKIVKRNKYHVNFKEANISARLRDVFRCHITLENINYNPLAAICSSETIAFFSIWLWHHIPALPFL